MSDEFVETCPVDATSCPWDEDQEVAPIKLESSGKTITLHKTDAHVARVHPEVIRPDWASAGELFTTKLWATYRRAR